MIDDIAAVVVAYGLDSTLAFPGSMLGDEWDLVLTEFRTSASSVCSSRPLPPMRSPPPTSSSNKRWNGTRNP